MNNVIEDVSKLTTISVSSLKDLMTKFEMCITHSVLEAKLNNEDIAVIDIGIGKLSVKITDDELAYKFIPSSKLEASLITALQEKKSPVIDAVEDSLTERILSVYKDLL